MENLSYGVGSVVTTDRARRNPLPETQAEAERLAASIERAVWRETDGGVQDLHVEVRRTEVRLTGRCRTYYIKQRAQHAAMRIPGGGQLTNDIEVT